MQQQNNLLYINTTLLLLAYFYNCNANSVDYFQIQPLGAIHNLIDPKDSETQFTENGSGIFCGDLNSDDKYDILCGDSKGNIHIMIQESIDSYLYSKSKISQSGISSIKYYHSINDSKLNLIFGTYGDGVYVGKFVNGSITITNHIISDELKNVAISDIKWTGFLSNNCESYRFIVHTYGKDPVDNNNSNGMDPQSYHIATSDFLLEIPIDSLTYKLNPIKTTTQNDWNSYALSSTLLFTDSQESVYYTYSDFALPDYLIHIDVHNTAKIIPASSLSTPIHSMNGCIVPFNGKYMHFISEMSAFSPRERKKQANFTSGLPFQLDKNKTNHHYNHNGFIAMFDNEYFKAGNDYSNMLGVDSSGWSWGAVSADFDLDGDHDVFVSNGFYQKYLNGIQDSNHFFTPLLEPNVIFENNSDLNFVGTEVGLPSCDQVAVTLDFDHDGDVDIITYGMTPGKRYRISDLNLYLNKTISVLNKKPHKIDENIIAKHDSNIHDQLIKLDPSFQDFYLSSIFTSEQKNTFAKNLGYSSANQVIKTYSDICTFSGVICDLTPDHSTFSHSSDLTGQSKPYFHYQRTCPKFKVFSETIYMSQRVANSIILSKYNPYKTTYEKISSAKVNSDDLTYDYGQFQGNMHLYKLKNHEGRLVFEYSSGQIHLNSIEKYKSLHQFGHPFLDVSQYVPGQLHLLISYDCYTFIIEVDTSTNSILKIHKYASALINHAHLNNGHLICLYDGTVDLHPNSNNFPQLIKLGVDRCPGYISTDKNNNLIIRPVFNKNAFSSSFEMIELYCTPISDIGNKYTLFGIDAKDKTHIPLQPYSDLVQFFPSMLWNDPFMEKFVYNFRKTNNNAKLLSGMLSVERFLGLSDTELVQPLFTFFGSALSTSPVGKYYMLQDFSKVYASAKAVVTFPSGINKVYAISQDSIYEILNEN